MQLFDVSTASAAGKTGGGLPRSVLYSISARLGGSGLDTDAYETARGLHEAGILGRAIVYANQQSIVPAARVKSLRWHPVRLLSALDRAHYYGAKKHYLDAIARSELGNGCYDFFHAWSGECVRTLREAKAMGIPSVIEIPTWHRNKGKKKPAMTKSERERAAAPWPRRMLNDLLVSRQQVMEEYDLATLILVLSNCAADTFRAAGVPEEKLFYLPRGVDIRRFTPAEKPPEKFRAIFLGALKKRKGVHTLLEAWHGLKLKEAELVLVGHAHEEIKECLARYADDSVKLVGFCAEPEKLLRTAAVHIFPSTCEGSAKVTFEAAAAGLPQITTYESGDAVVDGETGIIIPCENVGALAAAIERLHGSPALCRVMGAAARTRMATLFTWDHFRVRLLEAYRVARERAAV
ncbi:MAG TPA: glycosyltransferase family 4 protein [Chthoniobacteraceae bacterium]|jgi:glycosyltransferase involved in cell wall biosynthesis|nr:glycosyltransferase family 4 protein [Chthoniobacteraceae bacterium]